MSMKSVLLFSGGMDSLMLAHLLQPDGLLYISSGAGYSSREDQALAKLIEINAIDSTRLIRSADVINLRSFERDDYIVPNRNIYYVTLASHFGERILLGALNGDRSCDKDALFCERMSLLLNHVWQKQHWTDARTFSIEIPYKKFTKTALVAEYLRAGGTADALLISYSCYTGREKPCGICKPCVRKYVALLNNMIIPPSGYYDNSARTHPLDAPWVVDALPLMCKGKFRGDEDADFLHAIEFHKTIVCGY